MQNIDGSSLAVKTSHYTKNVQSLLTGFKVLNVIFKSKFRVKDNTKELCFSDYFYGCFFPFKHGFKTVYRPILRYTHY